MQPKTHQTIKLSSGRHSSPEAGACVMELASMLAGEPFTDHPRSVCPVIASFLRAYNDRVDDTRRQDLYAYASKVVGSKASRSVEEARTARLARWVADRKPFGVIRLLLALGFQPYAPGADLDEFGFRVVLAIRRHDDHAHAQALALVDELLQIGAGTVPQPRRSRPQPAMAHRA
jgi:hypothetical protein